MSAVPGPNQTPRLPLLCALPGLHHKPPLMVALAQSPLLTRRSPSPEAALWWDCLPAPAIALPEILHVSLYPQHYNLTQLLLACHPLARDLVCGWAQSQASLSALPARFKKNHLWSVVSKLLISASIFSHAGARLLPCPTGSTDLSQPLPQCNAAWFTRPWLYAVLDSPSALSPSHPLAQILNPGWRGLGPGQLLH